MSRSFLAALMILLCSGCLKAAGQPPVFIVFERDQCSIIVDTGSTAVGVDFRFEEIENGDAKILLRGRPLISGESLFVADRAVGLRQMRIEEAIQIEGKYRVVLVEAEETTSSRRSRAPADRFAAFERLTIGSGEFVRGNVLCIGGLIESNGEINGQVVALFGDIELKETATCHRDVFAIGGRLERHSKSRIYGAFQSTESWKRSDIFRRRKRLYGHRPVEWMKRLSYDRVDGLSLTGGIAFQSEENAMPRFFAEVGYGLSSEEWKYRLGFEHRLFDYHQLVYGGAVHRLTQTADDWMCGQDENSVYALLFKQDFRDYYQGEGAELFVEQQVNTRHRFRVSYIVEELDSLPAKPRLWSLFGPASFRSNFSSIPAPERAELLKAYAGNGAELSLRYEFTTIPEQLRPPISGWWAQVAFQHSSKSLASDFSFDRWRLELRRYQELTRYLSVNSRAIYGRVSGSPPSHRLFYLGGIRTLRAHDPKEFFGRHMMLLNLEYLINPEVTVLDFGVLFDIGTTADQSDILSRGQWHGDFGLAAIVGEFLRIELTLPFNGSSEKLRPSVLISRSF